MTKYEFTSHHPGGAASQSGIRTFLVGGAVRDELLRLPAHERDYVVVGGSAREMLDAGYRQVGKDFPVFLHPATHEEYALARTERKSGRGYHGFQTHAGTEVTLEQDLLRRDLTINAMAKGADGAIVDPYGGRRDIENRLLRHVSAAFGEDPLRVLRVARFAARLGALGFSVAPETMALMRSLVASGEMEHLVAERVWRETARALGDPQPWRYVEVLRECGALAVLFPELDALYGVPQRADYHPEIDTGVHMLMVLKQATVLSACVGIRFAALVHDVGKGATPADILPAHHGHEARGVKRIRAMCQRLRVPNEMRDLALVVAREHGNAHRAFELRAQTVLRLFTAMDAFRRPQRLADFLIACEADARGRTGFERTEYRQANYLREAFDAASAVDVRPLLGDGLAGKAVGDALRRQRVAAIDVVKARWRPAG